MTNEMKVGDQTRFSDIIQHHAEQTTDLTKNKSLRLGGRDGGAYLYSKSTTKPSRMWLHAILDRRAKRASAARFVKAAIAREHGAPTAERIFEKLNLSTRVRRSDLARIQREIKVRTGGDPNRAPRLAARDFLDTLHDNFVPPKRIATQADQDRAGRVGKRQLWLDDAAGQFNAHNVLEDVVKDLEHWLSSPQGLKSDAKAIRKRFHKALRSFGGDKPLDRKAAKSLMNIYDRSQRRMLAYAADRLDRRERLLDAKGLGRDLPLGDMARGPGVPQGPAALETSRSDASSVSASGDPADAGADFHETSVSQSDRSVEDPYEASMSGGAHDLGDLYDDPEASASGGTDDRRPAGALDAPQEAADPYEVSMSDASQDPDDGFGTTSSSDDEALDGTALSEELSDLYASEDDLAESNHIADPRPGPAPRRGSDADETDPLEKEAARRLAATTLPSLDAAPPPAPREVTGEFHHHQQPDGGFQTVASIHRMLEPEALDDQGRPPPLPPALRSHVLGRGATEIQVHNYLTAPPQGDRV